MNANQQHNHQRQRDLYHRWQELQERITNAAQRAGRAPEELTALAVTKSFPVSDVAHLIELGFTDFGENRVSELQDKAGAEYAKNVTWHMVGQLQTNKVNHAVRWADVIHSCDRIRLVNALERAAVNQEKRLKVLIQVRLDDDPGRGGIAADQVPELADAIAGTTALDLRGVMAMAPRHGDPRVAFDRLQSISDHLRRSHFEATWISAGMSEDFEAAIAHGATHLRLGRGLLGSRPYLG